MYEIYEKLRDEKGLTDYQVAKETGINTSMFVDWKKGRSTPKIDRLLKIAHFFNVSVSYLIGEEIDGYYLNKETAAAAQEIFDNPDMRILFQAARDSRPEDLRRAADLLQRFKETNPDD